MPFINTTNKNDVAALVNRVEIPRAEQRFWPGLPSIGLMLTATAFVAKRVGSGGHVQA